MPQNQPKQIGINEINVENIDIPDNEINKLNFEQIQGFKSPIGSNRQLIESSPFNKDNLTKSEFLNEVKDISSREQLISSNVLRI